MAWKGESRRHSLARKGVKTANKPMRSMGRTVTEKFEVFKFDELPDDVKQKVLDNYWDINVDHEWWDMDGLLDLTGDEMKAIKIKLSKEWWKSDKPKDQMGNIIGEYPAHTGLIKYDIGSFDIGYDKFVQFENIEIIDEEIFRKFLGISKKLWNKLDYVFVNSFRNSNTEIYFEERDMPFSPKEEQILQRAKNTWNNKVNEAIFILKKNYEWLMEEEQIIDTIKANNYEFTMDGKIY